MYTKEIPNEIKRWNWGAFLLAPFWCLRHGVRFGFCLFIPFFALVVPFILGATGNKKAWIAGDYDSVDSFLKKQRFWRNLGFSAPAIIVLSFLSLMLYLNNSADIQYSFKIASSNKRLIEHLGEPIKKDFFHAGILYDNNDKQLPLKQVEFGVKGSKNKGTVQLEWLEIDSEWSLQKLEFTNSKGRVDTLIDSTFLKSSTLSEGQYSKELLSNTVEEIINEKQGNLLLVRSDKKNDFLQAALVSKEGGKEFFLLQYSNGFSKNNNELYESEYLFEKDYAIQFFSHYASGSDACLNLIEWNQLASVEQGEDGNLIYNFLTKTK